MTQQSKNLPAVIQRAVAAQRVDVGNVNLMLPTQTFGDIIGEYDKVVIEVVTVDSDPKAGEVAEISEGKFALQRVPLEKIGSAVGIIWDPDRTTILESTPTKSRAKATGALRKPNGEWIILTEEKTVNLDVFEDEQRLSIEEKADKGNFEGKVTEWGTARNGKKYPAAFEPWQSEEQKARAVDRAVRKAMLQYRKFADERAMTGAKERCIRALLAIKSAYTQEELARPFAFPRVIPDTGKMLADPQIRSEAIGRVTGTAAAIFGPGNGHGSASRNVTTRALPEPEVQTVEAGAPEDAPPEAEPQAAAGLEVVDGEASEEDPFADPAETDAPETPEQKARATLEDWLASEALPARAKATIRDALASPATTLAELQSLIDRATAYETRQKSRKDGAA